MSYNIEPMSVIEFIDDNKMKLPRFQRGLKWDSKQKFELAISVFQDYPVGVVIVNKGQNDSWLLDGRQRRDALTKMRSNPVELYLWAKTYLGFKTNDDENDLISTYWDKVEKFLQTEDPSTDDSAIDNVDDYGSEEEVENSFDSEKQRKGLNTLLNLILMVHQYKTNGSRWERAFDYTKYFSKIKYAPEKNGGKVNPVLLRQFLLELIKDHNADSIKSDDFTEYYYDAFVIEDKNKSKFENDVVQNWDYVQKSLKTIEASEKTFKDARIGVIRLTNVSDLDAQNIFSRINRGGTLLKAEELLSAKPFWNQVVNVRDNNIFELVKKMYEKLGTDQVVESVVKWDMAAIMLQRITDKELLFDSYSNVKDGVPIEQVTLGFKLISSITGHGMSSKGVTDLEKDSTINWDSDIDTWIDELNTVIEILLDENMFKLYLQWKKPMAKMLGNAITLEFLTIALLDWRKKGKPKTSSADLKAFKRDMRVLFDRLVYEYATKVWRGSGDSKMARDIENWETRISPIDAGEWDKFVKDACVGQCNGEATSQKTMTPILYYYYILNNKLPSTAFDTTFDVDHIIPQEKFKDNALVDQSYKDSLGNLALLPKRDNISKKSKALNEITDIWLKNQIVEYTGIAEVDFIIFSDISNIGSMCDKRRTLFVETFSTIRNNVLSN